MKLPAIDRTRGFVTLVAVVLLALGAGLGFTLGVQTAPAPLAGTSSLTWVDTEVREFTDARSAQLAVTLDDARSLKAPRAGVVTRFRCEPGHQLRSGRSALSISGVPMLNLATRFPLWRPIGPGLSGPDVQALHDELTRLGHPVKGGRATTATLRAFNALARESGVPVAVGAVRPDQLIWMPSASVAPTACSVQRGDGLSLGTSIAALPAQVTSARLSAMPTGLAAGDRVFAVDDAALVLDSAGSVDAAGLAQLSRHPQWLTGAPEKQASVSGSLRLATPIRVVGVPPAALGEVRGSASCVVTSAGVVPVTIVGSELGMTYVRADGFSGGRVSIAPDRSRTCS